MVYECMAVYSSISCCPCLYLQTGKEVALLLLCLYSLSTPSHASQCFHQRLPFLISPCVTNARVSQHER